MKKPLHIPRISTRGYYDLTTGKKLKNAPYFLYPKNSFTKLYGKKDMAIMVHGLRNDRKDAVRKFLIAKKRLRQLGYFFPVVGFTYDSNTRGANSQKTALRALRVGQKIAKQNGRNLSKFLIDFKKKSPQTKIRLLGHSLGTEVIVRALEILSDNTKNRGIIESVHFFGSSVPSNFLNPKVGGKIIDFVVKTKLKNFFSPFDEVLKESFLDNSVNNPLGYKGAQGNTPSKYVQKKVYPKNHRFVSYAHVLKSFP